MNEVKKAIELIKDALDLLEMFALPRAPGAPAGPEGIPVGVPGSAPEPAKAPSPPNPVLAITSILDDPAIHKPPLLYGRVIGGGGSQHPGFDAETGYTFDVPYGFKLIRDTTRNDVVYLVDQSDYSLRSVPIVPNPDPNNHFWLPDLPKL